MPVVYIYNRSIGAALALGTSAPYVQPRTGGDGRLVGVVKIEVRASVPSVKGKASKGSGGGKGHNEALEGQVLLPCWRVYRALIVTSREVAERPVVAD